ncbi:hypothetical protein BG004_003266 [Podila humilis]|nr:hypothetical protein BG004_003266 [Podila humilis]
MCPGVGLFYAGMALMKHSLSLMMLSVLAEALVSIQWYFWGFSLTFSATGGPFIGNLDYLVGKNIAWAPHPSDPNVRGSAFFLFQLMFAAINPALDDPYFDLCETPSVGKERGERLRKLAEQSSPILPMWAGSTIITPGQTTSAGGSAVSTGHGAPSGAAAGPSGIAQSSTPIPGGPPRPVKSSSGLFVSRKPAGGSFLRNNAPRPMPLPRNPSVGSLPLRSPRLDTPLSTPRLNPKSSRIQILDIQQGTEIMQSMHDAKIRKEQAEQRERELKKEQRIQELENKRQQDAEKKAQILREKEEAKKKKEDARKEKERQKHERDEKRERDKEEREREIEQQQQEHENALARAMPDDDDDEGTLASTPARKKSRRNSSRIDDDDDYEAGGPSTTTPSIIRMNSATPLTQSHSHHGIQDSSRATPMDESYSHPGDSYFPQQTQSTHRQSPPPVSDAARDHPTLFQDTNLLTAVDRAYIIAFLEGHPVLRPNMNDKVYQIVMNQEQVQDASGRTVYELILIEMNFETGEWRKIKRKRNKPHVPAASA